MLNLCIYMLYNGDKYIHLSLKNVNICHGQ